MASRVLATTTLEFVPAVPRNLPEVLAGQVESYMALGAFDALGSGEAEYRQGLGDAVQAFIEESRWSQELAEAGLLDVAVSDPRPSGEFFAKAGGVYCYITPDKCTDYEGIVIPSGVYVAQVQLGPKYKGVAPRDVRSQLASSKTEQCFTTKEGLTVVALRGHEFLRTCYMDLAGSISGRGLVPCLDLNDGRPCLHDGSGRADSRYGSASRGSVVPLGA